MEDIIGRTERVMESLQNYIAQAELENEAGLLARGKLYEFNQRYSEALDQYNQVPQASELYAEARCRISCTLLKAGNSEQALEVAVSAFKDHSKAIFNSLTAAEPTSMYTVLGDAQISCGLIDQAQRSFSAALMIESNDSHAAAQSARISLAKGDISKAKDFAGRIGAGQRYDDLKASIEAFGQGGDFIGFRTGLTDLQSRFDGV